MASIDVGIHPDPSRITTERFTGCDCPDFSVLKIGANDDAVVTVYVSRGVPVLDALQAALDTIRADMDAAEGVSS